MTFAQPQFFWFLLVPALLYAASLRRARAAHSDHPKIPRASLSPSGFKFPFSALVSPRPLTACAALACLVAALARPQGATLATPSFTQARDVLVAVDVSRSMLADDVAPDRLSRARLLVQNLADELRGERLGLLPFAGTAFLQSPLSADYEIFRTFLDELGPDMIPAGGSDFTALLRAADEAFGPEPGAPDTRPTSAPHTPDRYLIVLSDGEAESDTWRPLAEKLATRGVRILALGLGTAAGAMIPDASGGLVKDERGAVVLSRLNPATLQDLARLTDGAYRDASAWVDLPALLRETIARGRAARVATDTAPRREELFAWFLAPALALLTLSLAREFPVTPRPKRVSTQTLRTLSPRPPAASAIARLLPLALLLHSALIVAHSSLAATPAQPPAPAAPAPDPLVDLVARLAESPKLPASDLARLATLTADQAETARAPASPTPSFPEGAIRDALAAVFAGQASDPRAADWPALRKRLEALLAPPPKQPQPPQNQSTPDQKPQQKPEQQSDPSNPGSNSQDPQKADSPTSESSPPPPSGDAQDSPSPDSSKNPSPSGSSTPLGDLARPPEKPDAESSSDNPPPTPRPAASDQPPSDEAPTQQAGGVSTSGRDSDREASGEAPALDPSLIVPQQRLDRVRDNDAPARLFQLLQESENPETRDRPAPGSKQTW